MTFFFGLASDVWSFSLIVCRFHRHFSTGADQSGRSQISLEFYALSTPMDLLLFNRNGDTAFCSGMKM
jgi:hypothetical protein